MHRFRKFVKSSSFDMKLSSTQVDLVLWIGITQKESNIPDVFAMSSCRSLIACGLVKSVKDEGLRLTPQGNLVNKLLLSCGYQNDTDLENVFK